MVLSLPKAGLHLIAAFSVITALGAAAPEETASIAPLSPSVYDEDKPVQVTHNITAQNATFQSAPVPDQDVDGPADTTKPEASLSPKLLSQKSLFQGDGYYYGSSEQSSLDNRRPGVPGVGLSVPVK
jgi:hypothetical protein